MSYDKVAQQKQYVIVGIRQTIRALHEGAVAEIYIAKDASEKVTQPVLELAEKLNVAFTYVDSKKQLGKACGIDVSTSTAAIKRH